MALTAGTLSIVSQSSNSVTLASTAATGGTGPYTEAWYLSTTSGFTPGGGTLVSGASGLQATVTGLVPQTQYYAKVIYTDTGASNATVTSAQLATATQAASLNPNQFAQVPYPGQIDLRYPYDTVSAQISLNQATPLFSGAAVKLDPAVAATGNNTAPKLIACSSDTDPVFGFINFDIKTAAYSAGSLCEVSQSGNVIYLYATGAITRGAQVTLDLTTVGGVSQASASSGKNIVGWAYDGSAAAGQLIRVKLNTLSFQFA